MAEKVKPLKGPSEQNSGQTNNPDAPPRLYALPDRVWERQPQEGPEAFEAWQVYIAVKQESNGGIREVGRRLGKSDTQIGKWSKRWQWPERYRQYENYQFIMLEREQQLALRKESQKWAERKLQIREKGFDIGERLLNRASALLGLPVFDTVQENVVKTASGEEVAQTVHYNFQQHPRDARLFADTAIRLMRLSADMSTDNFRPVDDSDLDNLSDEEIDKYIAELQKMRNQTLGKTD